MGGGIGITKKYQNCEENEFILRLSVTTIHSFVGKLVANFLINGPDFPNKSYTNHLQSQINFKVDRVSHFCDEICLKFSVSLIYL